MTATVEALLAQIEAAFGQVEPPAAEEMFLPLYAGSDDMYEMMMAFSGKHWTQVPIHDLFLHRGSLIGLSGIGYRAYLPAYLAASLSRDERYAPDIRGFMLFGLRPLSDDEEHVTTARERLSRLDPAQRAVIASVLRYLETEWWMEEAGEIARDFESPGA